MKNYLVCEDGTVYSVKHKSDKIVLKPCEIDQGWTKEALNSEMYIKDTGNGYLIKLGTSNLALDYSEMHEFRLMCELFVESVQPLKVKKYRRVK